jgi:hypothetical protein
VRDVPYLTAVRHRRPLETLALADTGDASLRCCLNKEPNIVDIDPAPSGAFGLLLENRSLRRMSCAIQICQFVGSAAWGTEEGDVLLDPS